MSLARSPREFTRYAKLQGAPPSMGPVGRRSHRVSPKERMVFTRRPIHHKGRGETIEKERRSPEEKDLPEGGDPGMRRIGGCLSGRNGRIPSSSSSWDLPFRGSPSGVPLKASPEFP